MKYTKGEAQRECPKCGGPFWRITPHQKGAKKLFACTRCGPSDFLVANEYAY